LLDLEPGSVASWFSSQSISLFPFNAISILATAQIPAQMEFLVGTGGYGDPLERDPQVVIEDLADDYVSVERAKKDYGIVVRVVDEDMGEYEIDADETKTGAGLHPCQS
jgi:hypothetical protein